MAKYNSNIEIAQEISARLGDSPIPFESIYSIALEIYNELGGEPTQFDNVYSILLSTLPLVEGGIASKVIDDNVITTVKTWSSSKINSELSGKQNTLTAGEGIEISGNTISATPTDNATNDDIDSMFVTEIKLIREQTNDVNYIDWLVNTKGETMEYNGQTYYKWVSWANDYNNDGSWSLMEYPNIIVLTNTLDVQLPFNTNSPEFEYWINIDGEYIGENNYIHGDYTKRRFNNL